MNKVKVFRVMGQIRKPNYQTNFRKEVLALKPEMAVERLYSELGSRHRAKRFQIKILRVEEVGIEEVESPIVKKLIRGETGSGE